MDISPIQPANTDAILAAAIESAHKWEGMMGEEKGAGSAEDAFAALKAGKIELGHPQAHTYRIRPKMFAEHGLALTPEIEATMKGKDGYAYYLVTVPTLLYPGRGAQYRLLECQLTFKADDPSAVAIHDIFPEQLWRPVLEWGGELQLALDSALTWGAEIKSVAADLGQLGGELSGRVANENGLGSFIKISPFKYTLGRMEIAAEKSSQTAMWRLDSKEVIRGSDGSFVVLLKVPKQTEQITVEGAAQAEPSFEWLIAQVEHVFERLPEIIQKILKREKGLPMQDFQSWTLQLPK